MLYKHSVVKCIFIGTKFPTDIVLISIIENFLLNALIPAYIPLHYSFGHCNFFMFSCHVAHEFDIQQIVTNAGKLKFLLVSFECLVHCIFVGADRRSMVSDY